MSEREASTEPPVILCRDVRKSFGTNEVLGGVSLEVRRGEVLCIIGPSGSGKTTLLRTFNALESINSGSIWIEGNQIAGDDGHGAKIKLNPRSLREIRAELGMVFQKYNLFPHMTVLDNIIEAPIHVRGLQRGEAVTRAERLLEYMALTDKRDSRPSQLSGGQQQRVAMVRALAMEPKAILLDEVTSALDPELVGEVLKAMRDLARGGITMVVVTHEMQFAREVADRVVVMDAGVIIESGDPKRIFTSPQQTRTRNFLRRILHENINDLTS